MAMGIHVASPCRGMLRVPQVSAPGRDGRPGEPGFDVLQDGDPSVTRSPRVPLRHPSWDAVPEPMEHGRCCGARAGIPTLSPGKGPREPNVGSSQRLL